MKEEEITLNSNEVINNIDEENNTILNAKSTKEINQDNDSSKQITDNPNDNIPNNINTLEQKEKDIDLSKIKNKENIEILENIDITINHNYSNTITEENINDNLNSNNTISSIDTYKNNNIKKLKSSLKGSSTKIKKIKNQIMEIFNDNNITNKLENYKVNNNPINLIDNFIKFQEIYENKIEELFNDKMKKVDEILEKYEPELNELNSYMEEEKELDDKEEDKIKKEEEKTPSAIQIMYDSLLEDKNNEIKKIQKEYEENRNKLKTEYKEQIDSDKIMQNGIYYKELFDNIKDDILKIIHPLNNKKISFIDIENKSNEEEEK